MGLDLDDGGPGERLLAFLVFVLIGLVFVGLAVFGLSRSVPHVEYSAGLAGTPGTLSVTACHHNVREKTASICEGTFRPAGGGRELPASIHATRSPGTRMAVRRDADGGYVEVGFGATAGWTGVSLLLLVVAQLGLLLLVALPLRERRILTRLMWTGGGTFGLAAVCCLAAGAAEVAESLG